MKLLLAVLLYSGSAFAGCTLETRIDGVIGPGTLDYVERVEEHVAQNNCSSVLLLLNTPGGNLQSTRLVVEKIINSKVPWLCYVHPAGAHAGSAGAIILQACHVAGAEEASNIGAATPISGGGETIPEDLRNKMINDMTSWLDSLTELRGRNREFGRDIVKDAKALSAKDALKIRAIDFVGTSIDGFLEFAAMRSVKLEGGALAKVETGARIEFFPDLRTRFLDLVTHPQISYMLFMGSLALIYFELTHPGMIAPGVFGALGLVISLISFHMLDVHWGGLALTVLGLAFLIAEAFVPSFGALGIGGIAAFIGGSLLLFDPGQGLALPLRIILPTAFGVGGLMMFIAWAAFKTRSLGDKTDILIGHIGRVTKVDGPKRGHLEVAGEIWKFESSSDVEVGEKVKVTSLSGLLLKVEHI